MHKCVRTGGKCAEGASLEISGTDNEREKYFFNKLDFLRLGESLESPLSTRVNIKHFTVH